MQTALAKTTITAKGSDIATKEGRDRFMSFVLLVNVLAAILVILKWVFENDEEMDAFLNESIQTGEDIEFEVRAIK